MHWLWRCCWSLLPAGLVCISGTCAEVSALSLCASSRKSRCSSFRAASRSPDAEDVRFPTPDGLTLRGCYLRTPQSPRRGVILFGLEFGSNRWSCVPYCDISCGRRLRHLRLRAARPGRKRPPARLRAAAVGDRLRGARLPGRPGLPKAGRTPTRAASASSASARAAAPGCLPRPAIPTSAASSPTASSPPTPRWCRTCASGSASTTTAIGFRHLARSWYYGLVGLRLPAPDPQASAAAVSRTWNRPCPSLAPRPLLMIHGGGRHLHQAGDGPSPVRPGPASRRSSGWSRAPSTTRRCNWPTTNTSGACWRSSSSIWPSGVAAHRKRGNRRTGAGAGRHPSPVPRLRTASTAWRANRLIPECRRIAHTGIHVA